MSWHEIIDDQDPYHRLVILLNDATDMLARLETNRTYVFDVWIMDLEDPTLLRQAGLAACALETVKLYVESVLALTVPQDHTTAAEARPLHVGWPV